MARHVDVSRVRLPELREAADTHPSGVGPGARLVPEARGVTPLRVAQFNGQRSAMALKELRILVAELRLDVVCLQEPYNCRGSVPHLSNGSRIVAAAQAPRAAVVVINTLLRVIRVSRYCTRDVSCVEVTAESGCWVIVSIYCSPLEELDLRLLGEICEDYADRPLVIAGDFNAKSPWWFSDRHDERGEELDEFIARHNLSVENNPHNPPTFENRAGATSNIDVTLCNQAAHGMALDWRVTQNLTSSDHNMIVFDLLGEPVVHGPQEPRLRFVYKRADWQLLRDSFIRPPDVMLGDCVDTKAREITSAIQATMRRSIPRVKVTAGYAYKPWTAALQKLRGRVRRARRLYQRSRVEAARQIKLQRYLALKTQFRQELERVRQESWQEFVEKNLSLNAWGVPYKLATGKFGKPQLLSTLLSDDGSSTRSWVETAQVLLRGLLPADTPRDDTRLQANQRRRMTDLSELGGVCTPFAVEEVAAAIYWLGMKKAPGPDGIKAEVLLQLEEDLSPWLLDLLNECLRQGRVPGCFKESTMVVLRKAEDRDPQLLSSYRPICLLNTLAKVQEMLLLKRLRETRALVGLSDKQYGFRRGRSTTDAITAALKSVEGSECSYVLGLFVDFAGAFDNLWWPYLFSCLRAINCPKHLYMSLLDYCSGRRVCVQGADRIRKITSKGCPQGSVLGPELWDVTIQPLLERLARDGNIRDVVAYADDVLVIVEANSRAQLEVRCRGAIEELLSWCNEAKMGISTSKTTCMFLRGSLRRSPRLRVGDAPVRLLRVTKYLGLHIDQSLSFVPLVEQARLKGERLLMKVATIGQRRFHLPLKTIATYHNSLLVSVVGYGAGVWAHKARDRGLIRLLRRTQRKVLMRFMGAFSTTPTMALLVVLGIWPLDLQIRLRGACYWLKREDQARVRAIIGCDAYSKSEMKRALRREWQLEWSNIQEGRRTYEFFPSVGERLRQTHIRPSVGLVHFLTGHGPYGVYLDRIQRVEGPECRLCGTNDTPEHALFECERSKDLCLWERQRLVGNEVGQILRDPDLFHDFNSWADCFSRTAQIELRNNGGRRPRPRPREPRPEPPRRSLRLRGEDPQQNDVEAAGDQRAEERPAREPRGRRRLLYVSTGRIEAAQRRRIRPVRLPGERHADYMVRVRAQLALRHVDSQEEPPDC